MGAPVGNKNAIGNKGGGRKSAYQEQQNAALLHKLWNEPTDVHKLERKIRAGKYTALDMYMFKIMTGNDKLLAVMFKRLFPIPPKPRTKSKKWSQERDLEAFSKRIEKLAEMARRKVREG